MTESLYKFLEGAVSPTNILFMAVITIISAIFVTLVFRIFMNQYSENSFAKDIITFIATIVICTLLFFNVRGKVSDYRQQRINELFHRIDRAPTIGRTHLTIKDWREGLYAISTNPSEIGYYIRTAEIFEKESDYTSAMILLELGMNHFQNPPLIICNKLQEYYTELKPSDRPFFRDCVQIIQIE